MEPARVEIVQPGINGNPSRWDRIRSSGPKMGERAKRVASAVTLRSVSGVIVLGYLSAALVMLLGAFAAPEKKLPDYHGLNAGRYAALCLAFGAVGIGLLILHGIGYTRIDDQKKDDPQNNDNPAGRAAAGTKLPGYGIFRPLVGADKRFSTSLSQIGLWTLAATTVFGYLLGRVVFENVKADEVLPGDRWDQYLILLGGPFAAAVWAKAVVASKIEVGNLQKPEANETKAAQVLTGDRGNVDLVDAQYLLFNMIALAYFVIAVWDTPILPDMPGPLLAMTSATAALYAGNKAAVRNTPLISAVSPRSVKPGDSVIIRGQNFDPVPDSPNRQFEVNLSGTGTKPEVFESRSDNTKVEFAVPRSATAGLQQVTVVSTAGVETAGYELEIRSAAPVVTGLPGGALLRPGRFTTLLGANLDNPDGEKASVRIGPLSLDAVPAAGGDRITFTPPAGIDANQPTIQLTVVISGKPDTVVTVPVELPRIQNVIRTEVTPSGGQPGSGDRTIEIVATGLDRGATQPPRILCNGREAKPSDPDVNAWQNTTSGPLRTAVPGAVSYEGDIRVVLIDDLGRRTGEWLLTALP